MFSFFILNVTRESEGGWCSFLAGLKTSGLVSSHAFAGRQLWDQNLFSESPSLLEKFFQILDFWKQEYGRRYNHPDQNHKNN